MKTERLTTARRTSTMVAALVMAVLGTASVAWACSSQPRLNTSSNGQTSAGQTSGPSGTRVTVSGSDFGAGPIEVRWDSRSGQLLAETQGPSFSVPVTIPPAPQGAHYIIAFQTVGTGTASMAFEVTAPSGTNNSGTTSTGEGNTSTSASGTPDEDESTEPATTNNNGGSTGGNNSSDDGSNTTGSGSSTGTGATNTGTNQATTGGTASADAGDAAKTANTTGESPSAPASRTPRPASANAPAVTADNGRVVFGGSSAAPVDEVAGISSSSMVSGDTWSGFAGSTKPSLLSEPDAFDADQGSGPAGLGLALGLLAAGMAALFAGFGVAEVSRKRALAMAPKR